MIGAVTSQGDDSTDSSGRKQGVTRDQALCHVDVVEHAEPNIMPGI